MRISVGAQGLRGRVLVVGVCQVAWRYAGDKSAVAVKDVFIKDAALQMLSLDFVGVNFPPQFPRDVVTVGRHEDGDAFLRVFGKHHVNGATHVGVRSHDQRAVKQVHVRVVDKVYGEVYVALLFLVRDPRCAALRAFLALRLEVAAHDGDALKFVRLDERLVPRPRFREPVSKCREVVDARKLFSAAFHKGVCKSPKVDPFQAAVRCAKFNGGMVEVEAVDVARHTFFGVLHFFSKNIAQLCGW